jgi:ABC-type dipeptide/oligopeptide/nickel transport system permease subunit
VTVRKIVGLVSLLVLVLILLACAFPTLITQYEPNEISFAEKLTPPSKEHPMGTDDMGRDLLARVLYGGRVTIWSSLIISAVSIAIATLWAAVSAYAGGAVDELMTRVVDVLMNIPDLLLVLLLVSILKPGMKSLVVSLTVVRWTSYSRIIRGQVYSLLNAEYITASQALGASGWHVVRRHIIPNTLLLVITLFGLNFGSSMLSISSLSFLGFGVQLPQAEWGAMINAARPFLQTRPYLMFYPGLAIVLTILTANLAVQLLRGTAGRELNHD